jgi:hypothetical protein
MSVQQPVVSTRYTIVEAAGTSTPVEVSIDAGCTQIVFATPGNTGVVFVVAGEVSPGGQTNFTSPNALPLISELALSVDYIPRSQRPGTQKMWVFGSTNNDILIVTQVIRNMK